MGMIITLAVNTPSTLACTDIGFIIADVVMLLRFEMVIT